MNQRTLSKLLPILAGLCAAALGNAQPIYTVLDLHPPGAAASGARGIGSGVIVGFTNNGFADEAAKWDMSGNLSLLGGFGRGNGVNASWIIGTDDSTNKAVVWPTGGGSPTTLASAGLAAGYAISGSAAVGVADSTGFGPTSASVWDLSVPSPSAISLSGDFSVANAVDGGSVVGRNDTGRATMWNLAPAPPTDLHDDLSWIFSEATGVSGGGQCGWVMNTLGEIHAVAWSGTVGSAVDLHIAGEAATFAMGMSGDTIVGFTDDFSGNQKAVAWIGPSHTVLDLHALLGAGYVSSSAQGVDAQGNIVGTARTTGGENHAIVWKKAQYSFGNFRHPLIDPDDCRIASFQRNRTIPVKIPIYDANGAVAPGLEVRISLYRHDCEGLDEIPVDAYDTPADDGDLFRFEDGLYRYNITTRYLPRGIYTVTATIVSTGQSHSVDFRVR